MFRRDIIEKIIKQRGDWELVDENDIDILYEDGRLLYEDGEYNNYELIALYRLNKDIEKLALEEQELYRLDVNGDNPFKLINKKEYQSYIRDEQINKILE